MNLNLPGSSVPTYRLETTVVARINQEMLNPHVPENFPSPIHCLPNEILENIFINLARDSHRVEHKPDPRHLSFANSLRKRVRNPEYDKVLNVCSHWRTVALNCPALWAYISLMSPSRTSEALTRSKQAPLKVLVQMDERYDSQNSSSVLHFVERVREHAKRIQELDLYLPIDHIYGVLPVLSLDAPRLQRLKISAPSFGYAHFPKFHADTPVLRTLEFSRCPVPLDSFNLAGLTTLSLKHVAEGKWKNIVGLLAGLSGAPSLTCLYLEEPLASATDFLSSSAFYTWEKIELPYLSRLSVVAPVSAVTAFLSCVAVPLRTLVKLGCCSEGNFPNQHNSTLFSLLAQRFSTSESEMSTHPTIRSLGIHPLMHEEAVLTFSTSARRCLPCHVLLRQEWDDDIPLQVVACIDRHELSPGDYGRTLCSMYSMYPLANVQSLHILRPPPSYDFWSDTLSRLPHLRHLKLGQGKMPDLTTFLAPESIVRADLGSVSQMVVPELEEVELYNLRLTSRVLKNEQRVRSLLEVLATRRESRGRLTMTKCAIVNDGSTSGRKVDLVSKWEGGHFDVVENATSIRG